MLLSVYSFPCYLRIFPIRIKPDNIVSMFNTTLFDSMIIFHLQLSDLVVE